jgi:hypothetical protein
MDREKHVDRILSDQNVVTWADTNSDDGPSYVTTRRIYRLVTRAVTLVDNSGTDKIAAITGSNHASVVEQISELCAQRCLEPLILGASLSDCRATEVALAEHRPVAGTVDMAIAGSQGIRKEGRERDVRLRQDRLVVVPHAERIDDRRLARLIVAVERVGSELILGHDQSVGTGVVCRQLAAYAADRVDFGLAAPEPGAVERLLRSGLVCRAVAAMSTSGRLEFGIPQDRDSGTAMFVACDDPRRITWVSNAIREDRVRAGTMGSPIRLEGSRGALEVSVGEWIVATGRVQGEPEFESGQFVQVAATDKGRNTIVVEHERILKHIVLGPEITIRPAAAISIREARRLPANASLIVELTDPRRTWAALLLAARHGEFARVQIAPTIARTRDELIDTVRRNLPAAFPHRRQIFGGPDARLDKIVPKAASKLPDLDFLPDQATVRVTTPPSINAAENVRSLLSSNLHARLGYQLLFNHVGRHNPSSASNAEHVLRLCGSELSSIVTRHLAGIEHCEAAADDDLTVFDLPPELIEMEHRHFDLIDVERLKYDLWTMTIPGSVWGTRAAFRFRARAVSESPDAESTNDI